MAREIKRPDEKLLQLDTEFLDRMVSAGSLDAYAAQHGIGRPSARNHLDRVRNRTRAFPELYTDILANTARAEILKVKRPKIEFSHIVDITGDLDRAFRANPEATQEDILGSLGEKHSRDPRTIANHFTLARKAYLKDPDVFGPICQKTMLFLEEGGNIPDRRLLEFAKDYQKTGNLRESQNNTHISLITAKEKIQERINDPAFAAQLKAALDETTFARLTKTEERLKANDLYQNLEQIAQYPTLAEAARQMALSPIKIFDLVDRSRTRYRENPDYFGKEPEPDIKDLLTNYTPYKNMSDDEYRETLDLILEHKSVQGASAVAGKPLAPELHRIRKKARNNADFLDSLNQPQKELTLYGLGMDQKPFSWQMRSMLEVTGVLGVGPTAHILGYERKTDFINTIGFWQKLASKHPELGLTEELFALPELEERRPPHPGHETLLVTIAQSPSLADAARTMNADYPTFYNWYRETRRSLQSPENLNQLDWQKIADASDGQINNLDDALSLMAPRIQANPTFTVRDLVDFARDVADAQPKSLYGWARASDQSPSAVYYKDAVLKGLIQLGIIDVDAIPSGYPDVQRQGQSSGWLKQQALNAVSLLGSYEDTARCLGTSSSNIRYRTMRALIEGYEITPHFDAHTLEEQNRMIARGPEQAPGQPILWLSQFENKPPELIFQEPMKPAIRLSAHINKADLYEIKSQFGPNAAPGKADTSLTPLARGNMAFQAWDRLGAELCLRELSDTPAADKKPLDLIEGGLHVLSAEGLIRPWHPQGKPLPVSVDPVALELVKNHHDAGYPWYSPQQQMQHIRYQKKSPGAAAIITLSREIGAVIDPVAAQDFADAAEIMKRPIQQEALTASTRLEKWREKNARSRKADYQPPSP